MQCDGIMMISMYSYQCDGIVIVQILIVNRMQCDLVLVINVVWMFSVCGCFYLLCNQYHACLHTS